MIERFDSLLERLIVPTFCQFIYIEEPGLSWTLTVLLALGANFTGSEGPSSGTWRDDSSVESAASKKLFQEKVSPILCASCLGCHSSGKKKGGLDLSSFASAKAGGESGDGGLVPGKPEESAIVQKIESGEMPPNKPLDRETIDAFRKWIESGASYGGEALVYQPAARRPLWSLLPVARPSLPVSKVFNSDNPVDLFIGAMLAKKGLAPIRQPIVEL